MATLARASAGELAKLLTAITDRPQERELRQPETGLVMLRGRIGGDGAPFNLGEATVTRTAVRLESGETGFAYVLGRDDAKARLAALCDALWQSAAHRRQVEQYVLAPIRARLEDELAAARSKTAATKVEFFTLVRGED